MIPPDFLCRACRVRPIHDSGDLCAVCEGDAQRSDILQAEAVIDSLIADIRDLVGGDA